MYNKLYSEKWFILALLWTLMVIGYVYYAYAQHKYAYEAVLRCHTEAVEQLIEEQERYANEFTEGLSESDQAVVLNDAVVWARRVGSQHYYSCLLLEDVSPSRYPSFFDTVAEPLPPRMFQTLPDSES